jgi:fructosamine-3-kinase
MEKDWEDLSHQLGDWLAPAEDDGPSLLHGDLWQGNVLGTAAGPALIDPSCYYGHREVDLAMADLFGGFGPEMSDAYTAIWPLSPGADRRRRIYQLYYLLVHVNLFGRSYVPRTRETLRAIFASTGARHP